MKDLTNLAFDDNSWEKWFNDSMSYYEEYIDEEYAPDMDNYLTERGYESLIDTSEKLPEND